MSDLSPLLTQLSYLDEIYAKWRQDSNAVDPSWRALFGDGNGSPIAAASPPPPALTYTPDHVAPPPAIPAATAARLARTYSLVNAYRVRGHLEANLDPLGMFVREPHPELNPGTYGFTDADFDQAVLPGGFHGVGDTLRLRELLMRLRQTYCGSIGLEFMHISNPARRQWLAERMERPRASLMPEARLVILDKLIAAETFERFCHTKYVGTKRFSLEGGETLIPLLDLVLEHAGRLGVDEVVMGMAHRGRLNVLVNVLGKKPRDIFAEFEDIQPEETLGGGDVKYHLGHSSDHTTRGGQKIHLSLAFNPSHLEAVDPVVVGRVRGKQRRRRDWEHARVLGLLIHGDAAFAGQGLVAETLNLSELHGYRTGGTVHVIVNNQIGFTTTPAESRSTPYATDVAKMIQCPIFHVNGEDPEAVAFVVQLAMEYRDRFRGDLVIDMFCYRKYGHNESDEPAFTQPLLYRRIEQKQPILAIYSERLIAEEVVERDEVTARIARAQAELDKALALAKRNGQRARIESLRGVWEGYLGGADRDVPEPDTGVPADQLGHIGDLATAIPEGFHIHPKVARIYQQRRQMAHGQLPVDWGTAEILAYGTILLDRRLVRLSGQDSTRGTFSHRHAAVVDQDTGEEWMPLAHLTDDQLEQGECRIYDSPLSEAGVLGFEFGYSLDYPDGLVIWEAQFGDFVNGGQVLIDQFITTSEDKWRRLSGLVLFLPHGYEGQGPEHSSARFERFIQQAAEDNIQIVQPTTPAQMFHVLRRQVVRPWRKPLIVLMPKSLLRLPAAMSPLADLTSGRFRRLLPDDGTVPPQAATRVFCCSGKIFYELHAEREKRRDGKTGLIRVEQLYPLQDEDITSVFAPYENLKEIVWVQDEPVNMGAYRLALLKLQRLFPDKKLRGATRPESASPATGSSRAHAIEQRALMDEAFGTG